MILQQSGPWPEGFSFMVWRNRNRLLAIVTLVVLAVSSGVSRPRKLQRLPNGVWGGQHISIEVSGRSASVEYDCAKGTINGPLTLDSKGQFTWRGTHNREHPGPVRRGVKPNSQPATYTGLVKGNTMTLTVKLDGSDEALGTYTLKRGDPGRV